MALARAQRKAAETGGPDELAKLLKSIPELNESGGEGGRRAKPPMRAVEPYSTKIALGFDTVPVRIGGKKIEIGGNLRAENISEIVSPLISRLVNSNDAFILGAAEIYQSLPTKYQTSIIDIFSKFANSQIGEDELRRQVGELLRTAAPEKAAWAKDELDLMLAASGGAIKTLREIKAGYESKGKKFNTAVALQLLAEGTIGMPIPEVLLLQSFNLSDMADRFSFRQRQMLASQEGEVYNLAIGGRSGAGKAYFDASAFVKSSIMNMTLLVSNEPLPETPLHRNLALELRPTMWGMCEIGFNQQFGMFEPSVNARLLFGNLNDIVLAKPGAQEASLIIVPPAYYEMIADKPFAALASFPLRLGISPQSRRGEIPSYYIEPSCEIVLNLNTDKIGYLDSSGNPVDISRADWALAATKINKSTLQNAIEAAAVAKLLFRAGVLEGKGAAVMVRSSWIPKGKSFALSIEAQTATLFLDSFRLFSTVDAAAFKDYKRAEFEMGVSSRISTAGPQIDFGASYVEKIGQGATPFGGARLRTSVQF